MPTVPDEIQQATSGCLRTWDNFLGQLYQAFSWGWQKHSTFGTQQWFLLPARGPVIPYPFQVSGKLVYSLVVLFLDVGHLDAENLLDLRGKRFLNVFLDATQQVRLQLGVQVLKTCLVGRVMTALKLFPPVVSVTVSQKYTIKQNTMTLVTAYVNHCQWLHTLYMCGESSKHTIQSS